MTSQVETSVRQLLGVDATAERLGVSAKSVRRLHERGELRAVRIGTRLLFSVEEIARFVKALEAKRDAGVNA